MTNIEKIEALAGRLRTGIKCDMPCGQCPYREGPCTGGLLDDLEELVLLVRDSMCDDAFVEKDLDGIL